MWMWMWILVGGIVQAQEMYSCKPCFCGGHIPKHGMSKSSLKKKAEITVPKMMHDHAPNLPCRRTPNIWTAGSTKTTASAQGRRCLLCPRHLPQHILRHRALACLCMCVCQGKSEWFLSCAWVCEYGKWVHVHVCA